MARANRMINVVRSLSVVKSNSAKYAIRMKTSVAMTFAMIAPTKNPSSRLKIVPQESQRCFRLNGLCTIDERPQTGHFNLRLRPKVSMIVRGSRFIQLRVELYGHHTEHLYPRLVFLTNTLRLSNGTYFAVFFAALRLCVKTSRRKSHFTQRREGAKIRKAEPGNCLSAAFP